MDVFSRFIIRSEHKIYVEVRCVNIMTFMVSRAP